MSWPAHLWVQGLIGVYEHSHSTGKSDLKIKSWHFINADSSDGLLVPVGLPPNERGLDLHLNVMTFKSKAHELVISATSSSRDNNKRMIDLQDQEVHSLMESTVSCEGKI
jgi:hypothetical protein